MRVIEYSPKRGLLRLKVEVEDDLWLLYTIIAPGDVVVARTTREVKVGINGARSRRIPMTLAVKVKAKEFQPFTGKLRIRGIIVEGPEEYGLKGSHHTISVGRGSELTLIREEGWPNAVLRRLERSSRARRIKVVICAVDRSEVAIGVVHDYGLETVLDTELRVPGKVAGGRGDEVRREVARVVRSVLDVLAREGADALVVAGPSLVRERVATALRERVEAEGLNVEVLEVPASTGGVKGLEEALKRGALTRVLEEVGMVVELRELERLLKALAKRPELVAYGLDDVEAVARIGAVDTLLILDEYVSHYDAEVRGRVVELMEAVESFRGKVLIVSSHHEAGRVLKGLGSVAAILRYPVHPEARRAA